MGSVLYVADRGMPSFQTARLSVDVVCAGDSITGWNNFGVVRSRAETTFTICAFVAAFFLYVARSCSSNRHETYVAVVSAAPILRRRP